MSYISKIKYLFTVIAIVAFALPSMAQREKNYIYLFDCTGSMHTNGLWGVAQSALDKNISLRASIPGAQFAIIPFGDKPYETISFNNDEYAGKKKTISNAFDKYIKEANFTKISAVLSAAFKMVDVNKDNEIYLFTDGLPNGGDSADSVAKTISEWCANHSNTKLVYVALKEGIINSVIKDAIDACPDASIVQCQDGTVPVISEITASVYTSLDELDNAIDLSFSVPGEYNLTSKSTDDLFGLSILNGKASDGKINIKINPQGGRDVDQLHKILQGREYEFTAEIQCADPGFLITNPLVRVHVLDSVPSKLTLARGEDELKTEGVSWYDSFLWSDEAKDYKVTWDLAPSFRNELQTSSVELEFLVEEDRKEDFQAWFNGRQIKNGSKIKIVPDQPALLEVLFNHDAATGNRYFELIPVSVSDINIINGQPSESYNGTSLRTTYHIGWNPLKTVMFWLAVVVSAVILLWLVILKHIIYPTIRLSKVTFTGPGTYYSTKRIRGARKILLTSNRQSQNIFSRIFTGEIRFVKAEHFTPDIAIVPAGGKKKVKLIVEGKPNSSLEIYPSTIFGQYDKGTITNQMTKEKYEIEFS